MNLHDELGRAGAEATGGSAERLVSGSVVESLGARVRRGRRQRALGGAGVVAGVGVAAVGLWAWLPLGGSARDVEPAASLFAAGDLGRRPVRGRCVGACLCGGAHRPASSP
ncbi:hypothetical protein [Demequina litorisediminis]|uniref:Uncharacterized protein n=1 Tax=Demequina litorisediminis TaxID=1849022 RepID=A0ABQ6ICT1_9MICO|nr:hypothetical protein [Demequina litorisediminis]GMA35241.1 hypothetical protein GCM10025876_14450 [Demequina litorisediminis]